MNLKKLALGVTAATAMGSVTLLATPAQAAPAPGSARVGGATVYLYGGAGAANWVTVTRSGRVVTFDDVVAITPGAGCRRVGSDVTRVACTTVAAPTLVVVSTGDQNDGIFNRTDLPIFGYGGNGNDTLGGGSIGNERLYGGAGNDKIYGGAGGDLLYGGAGNDGLYGGDGGDELDGEAGADLLQGNGGNDTVSYWHRTRNVTVSLDGKAGDGEKGENDTVAADIENVWGGSGNDIVLGDAKDNFLDGRAGKNYIRGGAGKDNISASNSTGNTIYGDAGDDFINGSMGNDIVSGDDGRDTVYGLSGADSVYGGAGDDWLEGDAGNDLLSGAAGNDWLVGDAGDDKLHGGAGNDNLRGTGHFADDQSDTEKDWANGDADTDSCYVGTAGTQLGCE